MTMYWYKAVTSAGEINEGTLEAITREEVIARIQALGHLPIRAEEVGGSLLGPLTGPKQAARGASPRLLPALIRQLETLLRAGLPLDRVLELLRDQAASKPEQQTLDRLLQKIRGGLSLSEAMSVEPLFPPFCVSIIRAGEAGGTLVATLGEISIQLEKSRKAKEKLQSALLYPAIVTTACGLSLVFLLTFVVPRFQVFFENTDAPIPALTQVVLWASEALQTYGWVAPFAGLFVFVLARMTLRDPVQQRRWARRLLSVPLFGMLILKVETAQFCRALGTLLKNGVALTRALEIARGAFRNPALAAAVAEAGVEVTEGRGLSEPLARTGLFPRFALRLLRIGEEAARLDDMLLDIAEVYDREVERDVERAIALLGPALTIGLGLLVALIVGSILIALLGVYQLAI